jgi:hypothetical protein
MMSCDRIREQIPEALAGKLEPVVRENLIEHLETCSACRAEAAELGVVWRALEAMGEPEPSPQMRARFLETLHAYEEGFQEAQRKQAYAPSRPSWWASIFGGRPVWGAALAAAMLAAGLLGGRFLLAPSGAGSGANTEISQLRGQVETLHQLVALSLLQEQSASARLRGVSYSNQMTQPDREVQQALLHAVNHDSNVNVRLSAVDALAKFASSAEVRKALIDSLPMQDSPLVEIALIDLLTQLEERGAVPALRKLAQQQDANESVRARAAAAAEKLGGTQ